jgi:hypothetical protein
MRLSPFVITLSFASMVKGDAKDHSKVAVAAPPVEGDTIVDARGDLANLKDRETIVDSRNNPTIVQKREHVADAVYERAN